MMPDLSALGCHPDMLHQPAVWTCDVSMVACAMCQSGDEQAPAVYTSTWPGLRPPDQMLQS